MKLVKRGLLVIACLAATEFNQPAIASEASASLDWSQLRVSVLGIDGSTPTVTFSDPTTNLSSSALIPDQTSDSDVISVANWTSPVSTEARAGATSANTAASPLTLSGHAQATAAITGPGHVHNPVEALASGRRSENFSLDGPGVLSVSIPYTISIIGGMPFNFFDAASAFVSGNATFESTANNGSPNSTANVSFSVSSFEGPTPHSQSGNLVFDIVASGSGTGYFDIGFNLSTQAPLHPVPEPESYIMLLMGLGLMGILVRRRTITSTERVG